MSTTALLIPQSLEDFRKNRFETVEHFATQVLGVPTSTYTRLLQGRGQPSTMRAVAQALGVTPHAIAEFVPEPSTAYLQGLQQAVARAQQGGWLIGDPITGLPTGERSYEPIPHDAAD